MENNPSNFKGKKRPVENISWDDCQGFMDKINSMMSGLEFCLPTEAQWEYACRAGTKTPFSFGNNVTVEQVNYNGNHPYQNTPKEKYRKETVESKSLPCNSWGLYEMHGNVWEWCYDWYGDYSKNSVVNPTGPDVGTLRVLRGGSWLNNARLVRSACRYLNEPDSRNFNTGFRLARGQKSKGKAAELPQEKG